jgi:hypothetical protein
VFNIAIGADSADLQRTARSALLQMLNTIVKRVTQAAAVSLCFPFIPSSAILLSNFLVSLVLTASIHVKQR